MQSFVMKKTTRISTFVVYLMPLVLNLHSLLSDRYSATLKNRATSYIAYESWNTSETMKVSFRFKTYCSSCLLLYVDNTPGNKEYNDFLRLSLLKGKLDVKVHTESSGGSLIKKFTLSSNLNDIKWHHIEIMISGATSYVKVDNESKSLVDEELSLSSRLYLGGIRRDANISDALGANELELIPRFVGCIGSVTYLTKKRERRHAQEKERMETTSGCEDPCKKDSCRNGGRCLNWFIGTGCDCIGTGYQGPRCTRAVSESIFLNKTDYITIKNLYSQDVFKFTLRFSTRQLDGLLIATNSLENGFYVAVVDGDVKVSLNNKRRFFFGDGWLSDTQWHYLTITVTNREINAELDGNFSESWKITGKKSILNFPLYIGGAPGADRISHSKLPTSFVGCLQQVYVQKINIIYKVVHTTSRGMFSSSKLQRKCPLKREDFNEAHKRISAERLRRASTPAPVTFVNKVATRDGSNKDNKAKPTQLGNRGNGYAKLAAKNSKDLIAWITSGVVSGTIVLMIMTACAIHYFKYKYENIFVSRMQRQESIQEQQSVNNIQIFPKQQAVVYIPEQQLTKVVNL